jgi:hypothetical protein
LGVYDIDRLTVFIIRGQEQPDVRAPTDLRQAGIQLAMREDRTRQVENDFIQGESLAAIESGRVGKTERELTAFHRPTGVLWVEVKVDPGKVNGSIVGKR